MSAAIVKATFEGHDVTTVVYKGKPCMVAADLGLALGYGSGGRKIKDRLREWGDELESGVDYDVLEGQDLADFKALSGVGPKSGPSRAPSLTILYESGVHLVCIKTEKPAGRAFRRWLADEVLPQLMRTGKYAPDSPNLEARMAAVELGLQQTRDALLALPGQIAKAFDGIADKMLARLPANASPLDMSVIGGSGARRIRKELKTYGAYMHLADRALSARSWQAHGAAELRGALGFAGPGRRWELLPMAQWNDAWMAVEAMLQRAHRASAAAIKRDQGKLDLAQAS